MFALPQRFLRGGGARSSLERDMVGEQVVPGTTAGQLSMQMRRDTNDEDAGYLSIPVSLPSLRGCAEAVAASPSP
jgi:hypothetical protein